MRDIDIYVYCFTRVLNASQRFHGNDQSNKDFRFYERRSFSIRDVIRSKDRIDWDDTSRLVNSPRRVACVREGEVSGAQLVQHPQNGQTRSNRVASFDPYQAR